MLLGQEAALPWSLIPSVLLDGTQAQVSLEASRQQATQSLARDHGHQSPEGHGHAESGSPETRMLSQVLLSAVCRESCPCYTCGRRPAGPLESCEFAPEISGQEHSHTNVIATGGSWGMVQHHLPQIVKGQNSPPKPHSLQRL